MEKKRPASETSRFTEARKDFDREYVRHVEEILRELEYKGISAKSMVVPRDVIAEDGKVKFSRTLVVDEEHKTLAELWGELEKANLVICVTKYYE